MKSLQAYHLAKAAELERNESHIFPVSQPNVDPMPGGEIISK
jgi:hypothetical protein